MLKKIRKWDSCQKIKVKPVLQHLGKRGQRHVVLSMPVLYFYAQNQAAFHGDMERSITLSQQPFSEDRHNFFFFT